MDRLATSWAYRWPGAYWVRVHIHAVWVKAAIVSGAIRWWWGICTCTVRLIEYHEQFIEMFCLISRFISRFKSKDTCIELGAGECTDPGDGIPPKHRSKSYDPFFHENHKSFSTYLMTFRVNLALQY